MARPAGEDAVQRTERNTGEPAGGAPLQAAKGQGPDQPDEAPPQGEIRLAAATVHADPLPIHRLQFGLNREDKHLDVGQSVPAVAAAGPGNGWGGRRRPISGDQGAGARHRPNRHRPNMVSPRLGHVPLRIRAAPAVRTQFAYSLLAIKTALTLKAVFRLALRQTEGLIGSILHLPF